MDDNRPGKSSIIITKRKKSPPPVVNVDQIFNDQIINEKPALSRNDSIEQRMDKYVSQINMDKIDDNRPDISSKRKKPPTPVIVDQMYDDDIIEYDPNQEPASSYNGMDRRNVVDYLRYIWVHPDDLEKDDQKMYLAKLRAKSKAVESLKKKYELMKKNKFPHTKTKYVRYRTPQERSDKVFRSLENEFRANFADSDKLNMLKRNIEQGNIDTNNMNNPEAVLLWRLLQFRDKYIEKYLNMKQDVGEDIPELLVYLDGFARAQMTHETNKLLLEKQLQDPTSAAFKQKRAELIAFIKKKRENSTRKFAPEEVILSSDDE